MVNKENTMKLSDQAIGAIMLALQNSLLEQTDIVPVLRGFKLESSDNDEVIVLNPPVVKNLSPEVSFKEMVEN